VRDLIHGAVELEQTERGLRPHRLPAWARAQTDDPQLHLVESMPSGVRLRARTRATWFELEVQATRLSWAGGPARPDGLYDVYVDGALRAQPSADAAHLLSTDPATGETTVVPGGPATIRVDGLSGHEKLLEVWLPHGEPTELLDVRADAPLEPAPVDAPRWVHHGSSISHGSIAPNPTGTWPAVAARRAGVDLLNLGYGGSAVLDPFVARTIRDLPADLISLKLGINLVNHDLMRLRALRPAVHGYLDTIRDGHPDTPLLLVSPIYCGIVEDVPGPTLPDPEAFAEGRLSFLGTGDASDPTRLTLTRIRAELARVVEERRDPQLSYVDGLSLYGESDAARLPLPDALHPDGETHQQIGERFAEHLRQSIAVTSSSPPA
jgi:hypothetical protein